MVLIGASDWLNTWLTPVWLLGLGALVALAIMLLIWLVASMVNRDARGGIPQAVAEGPLQPIFWIVLGLAVFAVVGPFVIRNTDDLVKSITRVPFTGTSVENVTVPGAPEGTDPKSVEIPVKFNADEIRTIVAKSDHDVSIVSPIQVDEEYILNWEVQAEEDYSWDRGLIRSNPFELEGMDKILVKNRTEQDANVAIEFFTAPLHPQTSSVFVTTVAILALFGAYMLLRWLFPKTAAIALATAKSEMATPLFLLLTLAGFFLIFIFMWFPYYTFGEDIKVLKDTGLTLIMVFAIFHAIWAASNSVATEIDGKTALTVLSKPIGRRQFILGKFFGISWSTAVMFCLLGVWLLVIVAYKPVYDARESSNTAPTWQVCHLEMIRTVPGLFLAYLETLVFAAIGVAISTRLPMLANIMICFAIYAFGHLTPLLVLGAQGQFENVTFVASFIATVLPVLDHFNIQAAVAAGVGVSYGYLGMATIYCFLYCTVAMLLALVLFEDRDLA